MKMNRPLFEPGDIVQHFKRETIKEPHNNEYLYEIVGFAKHTETGEALVIYRALYGEKKLFARPKNIQTSSRNIGLRNIMECCTCNEFQADLLFYLARNMEPTQEVRLYLKG